LVRLGLHLYAGMMARWRGQLATGLRARSPRWVALLGAATLACSCAERSAPSPCPPCNIAGRLAAAPFALQARQLVRYRLPDPPGAGEVREEPWVFDLTIGFEGRPCAVSVVRGPVDAFAEAFTAAITDWEFRPRTTGRGEPACTRTTVFLYAKRTGG
jgi:hypothetical protein